MRFNEFLDKHKDHICERYFEPVVKAKSKKELADLMDINVCDWLAKTDVECGDVGEMVSENFGNYINGKFVNQNEGYTTSIHCGQNDEYIVADSDIMLFIDCDVELVVRKYMVNRIFCSRSKIRVRLDERAKLVVDKYGGLNDVKVVSFGEGSSVSERFSV